jgi:hypothetical protein
MEAVKLEEKPSLTLTRTYPSRPKMSCARGRTRQR